MKLSYDFTSPSEAINVFHNWAYFFSETFGITLQEFPEMTCLALFPHDEILVQKTGTENPWEHLKDQMGPFGASLENAHPNWMGFLAYEMGCFSFEDAKLIPFSSPYPLAHFLKHSIYLVLSQATITVFLYPEYQTQLLNSSSCLPSYFSPSFWDHGMHTPKRLPVKKSQHFTEHFWETPEQYEKNILKAKALIAKGDLFQINITQAIDYKTDLKPIEIYLALAKKHTTPFSSFINLDSYQVICASPERFLYLKNQKLQTRPIKGTLKKIPGSDDQPLNQLIHSSKEKAELMMICDLMRNDLGRVSQLGSIQCLHKRKLLSLSTLYHMESVIESIPLNEHPIDLIRPCFPPGSISGCPKIKAMNVISEIEQRARHLYCGAIGYFLANGDFDFNVAIRTGLYREGTLHYQVGGGITIDSDPEEEYEETLAKAISLKHILSPDLRAKQADTKKAPIQNELELCN